MKKNILWTLLDLIFIIVFNVVFFVVGGTEHSAAAWISYGFIHFSYLMLLITPYITKSGRRSVDFKMPLYAVSAVYFVIEFIVGIIFILIENPSVKVTVVVQVILAGLYFAVLISNLLANESTADNINRQDVEAAYMRLATSKASGLLNRSGSKIANKKIEEVYDVIRSSPAKSTAAAGYLESSILSALDELDAIANSDNEAEITAKCANIIAMAEERNRKVSIS